MVRILSKSMDEPMPLSMRIKKRIHFLICCWCQRYEEQLHYMRDTARQFPVHAHELTDVPVTSEMKERWKLVLRPSAQVVQDWSEKRESITRDSKPERNQWSRGLLLAAAIAVVMVAFVFSPFRSVSSRAVLSDYRDEMVGFAKVPPNLEMRSANIAALTNWLQSTLDMRDIVIPAKLQAMEPVGCRTLRFRGRDVGLICFRRTDGAVLHLFVTDRSMFPQLSGNRDPDVATAQSGWSTAAWSDGDHAYLLAVQGDQNAARQLLTL
jgi:hypothetical protein